jgi:hypothetical protein
MQRGDETTSQKNKGDVEIGQNEDEAMKNSNP